MSKEPQGMLSIWMGVGAILLIFGLIVLGSGVENYINPVERTVLAHLHPCLWWGAIMCLAGVVFLVASRLSERAHQGASPQADEGEGVGRQARG